MQDNDNTGPTSPVGIVDGFAVQLHEVYCSYVRAGFTEAQANEFAKVHLAVTLTGTLGGAS